MVELVEKREVLASSYFANVFFKLILQIDISGAYWDWEIGLRQVPKKLMDDKPELA